MQNPPRTHHDAAHNRDISTPLVIMCYVLDYNLAGVNEFLDQLVFTKPGPEC